MTRARALMKICVVVSVLLLLAAGVDKLINSRTVQVFGEHTVRVETLEKVIALTFDDGPTCGDLDAVLAAMGDVKGTFFVNGQQMQDCSDGAHKLVEAGHELGNHTWSHRAMVLVTPEMVEREIVPTDELIRAAGHGGEILVRPPYGKKLFVFPWWLAEHDRHTVMWDVSAETWDGQEQTPQGIADDTVARAREGSIVLLHPWDGRDATQEAIALVIETLREEGFRFVTLSELLAEE